MIWLWISLGVWTWVLVGATLAIVSVGWGTEKTSNLGIYSIVVLWPIVIIALPATFVDLAVTLNAKRIEATDKAEAARLEAFEETREKYRKEAEEARAKNIQAAEKEETP